MRTAAVARRIPSELSATVTCRRPIAQPASACEVRNGMRSTLLLQPGATLACRLQ